VEVIVFLHLKKQLSVELVSPDRIEINATALHRL
jgi:hypothetical protein